jgi:hypothetical protein
MSLYDIFNTMLNSRNSHVQKCHLFLFLARSQSSVKFVGAKNLN